MYLLRTKTLVLASTIGPQRKDQSPLHPSWKENLKSYLRRSLRVSILFSKKKKKLVSFARSKNTNFGVFWPLSPYWY